MVYRSFPLDTRNDAITRVLVMVHGAGRDADNYFRSTLAAAFLNEKLGGKHAVVVVPECGHNARCMFTAEVALPLIFPKQ